MNTPLTASEAKVFIRNNCSVCTHYKGRVGAIVTCTYPNNNGSQDIFDWKKAQGEDFNNWRCAAGDNFNKDNPQE